MFFVCVILIHETFLGASQSFFPQCPSVQVQVDDTLFPICVAARNRTVENAHTECL